MVEGGGWVTLYPLSLRVGERSWGEIFSCFTMGREWCGGSSHES